ncbi:MAG: pilus assembly protein PilZ [Moraxellaceae bacterium]|nr:MAG: pilus assembly protein PilZ [Moraxellaceae bacterium]
MDKKIQEKRLIKRQQLKSYLQVYNRKTGKAIGYIVNISSEGLRLVSSIPLLTHSVFQFRVKLPREVNGAKHLDFDALSCWCRPDVSPDSFDTGFKIVDAPQTLHDLVNGLTDYFSFKVETPTDKK